MKAIILNKIKFKEKDIICQLLIENGATVSCLFYGGAGGSSSKRKSSIIEVGHVLDITFNQAKKDIVSDLLTAKEYQLKWSYKNIRNNYQAFCTLSFYLELMSKLARPINQDELEIIHHEELFTILSNAIFYLDQDGVNAEKTKNNHLCLFFVKICHAMGVFPETADCIYCGNPLIGQSLIFLQKNDGGFACKTCLEQKFEQESKNINFQADNKLHHMFLMGAQTYYRDHAKIQNASNQLVLDLLDYLFFQFHFQKANFKTLTTLL